MTSCTVALFVLACIEAVSFPVQAEIEHASKTAGDGRSTPGVSKKIGEKWGGASEKGQGMGIKGIACSQSQTFYRTSIKKSLLLFIVSLK